MILLLLVELLWSDAGMSGGVETDDVEVVEHSTLLLLDSTLNVEECGGEVEDAAAELDVEQ